MTEYRDN